MAQSIPVPEPQVLLPPLLACLATASASSRLPLAISPLLTPILRQRVLLLSDSSPSESWLSLLCWNSDKASRLLEIARSDRFELHPVSGEVEYKDVDPIRFRQLDEETVHANVVLRELELVVVYLWCVGDMGGCEGGWKVAEVTVFDEEEDCGEMWYDSLQSLLADGNDVRDYRNAHDGAVGDEDDDAYWHQYDGTPAPQIPPQPLLPTFCSIEGSDGHRRIASEDEYFARYAQVQPALDNDDHQNEDNKESAASKYNFRQATNRHSNGSPESPMVPATLRADQVSPSVPERLISIPRYASVGNDMGSPLDQPRPSFSSGSSVVARLEETAALGLWADIGVKQHISASIKSLFRVARIAGVSNGKFAKLLKDELQESALLEADDACGPHRYISSSFYGLLRPARMAGVDRTEIERIVMTELAVLEMMGGEDTGVVSES